MANETTGFGTGAVEDVASDAPALAQRERRQALLKMVAEGGASIAIDVAQLILENAQLAKQVTRVQTVCSALLESSLARRVRAFHFRFGHPVRWTPEVPDDAQVRFRLKLITEEFLELLDAATPVTDKLGAFHDLETRLRAFVESTPLAVDLPEFTDAMGDLDFVVEGTRAVFGIDGKPIADAIYKANMTKAPVLDEHGAPLPHSKPTKPIGWAPPDVRKALEVQGWSSKPR